MSNDPDTLRNDRAPWPMPAAEVEDAALLADAGWWLTGGASLLLWTAIALVLTAT
jgi:hypothetical protein